MKDKQPKPKSDNNTVRVNVRTKFKGSIPNKKI